MASDQVRMKKLERSSDPGAEQRTMRALVFRTPGGPDVLSVIEVPIPEPNAGEVRVKVEAAPVFSADIAARSGAMRAMLQPRPYYMLGWELAGTVDAVGQGVDGVAPGDQVIGMSNPLSPKFGTQAEFSVLSADAVVKAPRGVSLVDASTIPANGLAAYQALEALDLPRGASVAVTGAAGAVGGYTIELAALHGLDVIGLAGVEDEQFVMARGARFIPRSQIPGEAIRAAVPAGVDGLIDAAGLGASVLGAIRDGGTHVALLPPAIPAPERDIRIVPLMVHPDAAQLRELASLVEAGKLTIRVASLFHLDEGRKAHELYVRPGLRGRIVLLP